MNPEAANSPVINARCAFLFPKGRRCRLPAAPQSSPFCAQHASFAPQDLDSIDVSAALLGRLSMLDNASDMQSVLGKIFLLLAQGRLTTKRAAVLTYIVQQLLRTLPAIDREDQPIEDAHIVVEPGNIPRPHRDSAIPSPASPLHIESRSEYDAPR